MNFDNVLPKNGLVREKRLSMFSAIISLIGVIFFNWQIGEIIYLFFYDLILIGIATVLRMIFARHQKDSLLINILQKLMMTSFFVFMYWVLLILVIAFTVSNLDLDSETSLPQHNLQPAIWLLAINQLAGFLFGYIYNEEYKLRTAFQEMFSTWFYALPIGVILVVIMLPNSEIIGKEYQNIWVASSIIILRFLFDMVATFIRKNVMNARQANQKT